MKLTRRSFLKKSAVIGSTTAFSTLPMSVSAAQKADGHKALVFVFLYGGNDAYNMLIPLSDPAYADYISARPKLGLKQEEILRTGLMTDNGVEIGIHNAMSSLLPLFESGQASAIINSGQLIEPTTRSGIETGSVMLPDFLMAHNLQQDMWQSGTENLENPLGWAGRMMDILTNPGNISPLFSIGRNAKLLRSASGNQTNINSRGIGKYDGWHDQTRLDGYFRNMKDQQSRNIYVRNYAKRMSDSALENDSLKSILDSHPGTGDYPNTPLAEQLKMVSRLIQAHSSLEQSRQVFFVSIGGFDTHKDQKAPHHNLLSQVSDALATFNNDLRLHALDQQVTSVTMSDFGRRLPANESGTDHGWGGHQLITGGAVQAGKACGNWPELTPNSENDYSNGRIIPGIAADQVNASLCRWFGLNLGQTLELFPNLSNFESPFVEILNR